MKTFFLFCACSFTLLTGCTCVRPPVIAPDDDEAVKTIITQRRTFDLRALFCSEEEIERMESGQICHVGWGWDRSKRHEVLVGERMPLDRVVRSIYGRDYDGQVKVISRDAILQTSLLDYDPSQQQRIWVHPGDLVWIQARD